MNKTTLKVFLGLLAFALAGCAGFFSITGLSMLFAGASLPVIIMATSLEFSKLVAASFLYQYWKKINLVLKLYLTAAVVILAVITSMGIYGFLSNAYQQTKIEYNLMKTSTDSLSNKKSSFEFQMQNLNTQLQYKNTQLDNYNNNSRTSDQVLNTLANQNRNISSITRNVNRTQKEISKLNLEIDTILKKITVLQDSVYFYDIQIKNSSLNSSKTSELGPLEYLSGILNTDMDKVVNWFILLFVIVFDPLAMALLIAFNFLGKKDESIEKLSIAISEDTTTKETVLDDHKQTENPDQITIFETAETDRIQKDTPEITNNSSEETIYEEQRSQTIINTPKKTSKIGYAGGISN